MRKFLVGLVVLVASFWYMCFAYQPPQAPYTLHPGDPRWYKLDAGWLKEYER